MCREKCQTIGLISEVAYLNREWLPADCVGWGRGGGGRKTEEEEEEMDKEEEREAVEKEQDWKVYNDRLQQIDLRSKDVGVSDIGYSPVANIWAYWHEV